MEPEKVFVKERYVYCLFPGGSNGIKVLHMEGDCHYASVTRNNWREEHEQLMKNRTDPEAESHFGRSWIQDDKIVHEPTYAQACYEARRAFHAATDALSEAYQAWLKARATMVCRDQDRLVCFSLPALEHPDRIKALVPLDPETETETEGK